MSNLTQIESRHRSDRWKDAGFVVLAGLLIALSVGAVSSMAAGKPSRHVWTVTVIDGPVEIAK